MAKKILFLLILATILPVLFFLAQHKKNSTKIVKQAASQGDNTDEPEPIILPGEIKAKRQVTLRFQTSGKLTSVKVEKGDQIKKGQILASLDQREIEKNMKKDLNNYLQERWDFEQTQDDYQDEKDNHLITDEIKRILEKAQFDLNNAVIDYEIKKLSLEFAHLSSPIDGIVTSLDQPIAGVNITPATAEITITDPDSVYFELEADEEEVTWIKERMTGKITLDAYPNQQFNTTINKISFAPKNTTGSAIYTANCSLPKNENLRFRLGMAGEIEVVNW
jgi:RND family efflux transporter MFP subunit